MKLVSLSLVGAYAVLNLVLAVAGTLANTSSALWARFVPALLFGAAALALGVGAWRRETALVLVGLVLASIAPVVYGALVEHSNVLLHHAVRAVVASLLAVAWALAFTRVQA